MVFGFIKAFIRGANNAGLVSSAIQKQKGPSNFIDISNARFVYFPKLPTVRDYEEKFVQKDQTYWDRYNRGFSHYKRGWYDKAKEEFLSIFNQAPHDKTYFTHLLRTYRKLVAAKKKPEEAFAVVTELIERCPNHTTSDIRIYNKLLEDLGLELPKKEILETPEEPEFVINGNNCIEVAEGKKPKGFKIDFLYEETSAYRIQKMTQALWPCLPHIQFSNTSISYVENPKYAHVPGAAYRAKTIPSNSEHFAYSTDDLRLRLAGWNMQTIRELDCSRYTQDKYHLRCVDLAGDLSHFIFTVVDECFLLDRNFNVIRKWRVPYKIDTNSGRYERRSRSSASDEARTTSIKEALSTLEITKENPNADDIKRAYREMTKQYHPDRNKAPDAEEKMRQILEAYDHIRENGLEGVDVASLEDEYWVEIMSRNTIEAGGISIDFEIGMSIDPSDWIYGSGISNDGARIYLGCYSGKVYQISHDGVAEQIYVITNGESATSIFENDEFVYIVAFSQMYIAERNTGKYIKSIQLRGESSSSTGIVRFFAQGFIHILDHEVILHEKDGNESCSIRFDSAPKNVFLNSEKQLIVETGKKLHLFQVNS